MRKHLSLNNHQNQQYFHGVKLPFDQLIKFLENLENQNAMANVLIGSRGGA